ncbi:MAG: hypothetical protein ACE5GX_20090 [Thermoanaerobaculia bacterium]
MRRLRFEKQFPEPLRCWISFSPRSWPGAEGWWLDLSREELVRSRIEAVDVPEEPIEQLELDRVTDVAYLPPVAPPAAWWRQELRQRLAKLDSDPVVQFFPGEEIEAGGGVPVVDLTPSLLPVRLRRLEKLPVGVHCCWPLIPGITTDEDVCRKGLAVLARAGVAGVQPVVPTLSAAVRRRLGALTTQRRGYQELFHGADPEVTAFARWANELGLAEFLERPNCGRTGRMLKNRRIASRLHLIGEMTLRTGGSLDESLTFYRAARWVDAGRLDVEDLARSGNLDLVPQIPAECAREVRALISGEPSERLRALEIAYRGEPTPAGT